MMALKLNCQLCGKHRDFNLTAVDDNGAAFEIPLCGNCIDSVNAIVRHRIDALETNVANLNEIIGVMAKMLHKEFGVFFTDCGGDFDIEACQKCNDYVGCLHGQKMDELASKLIELVGGE